GHRRRHDSAAHRTSVTRAPPGADHTRPARILARQLCGGARRDARPLSETSVARRAHRRRADPARQTPQHIKFEAIASPGANRRIAKAARPGIALAAFWPRRAAMAPLIVPEAPCVLSSPLRASRSPPE